MIDVGFGLIEVLLAIQMHQVQLVDQAQFLQELQRAIDGGAIDAFIAPSGKLQKARGIQMTVGFLDGFDQDLPLAGDSNASQG